jgi:hypothetical protein
MQVIQASVVECLSESEYSGKAEIMERFDRLCKLARVVNFDKLFDHIKVYQKKHKKTGSKNNHAELLMNLIMLIHNNKLLSSPFVVKRITPR